MTRGRWIGLGAAIAVSVGLALAYDAWVVTDEERLEELIDDVRGPVTRAHIAAARARWLDLARQPFEISAFGRTALYREGEEAALDRRVDQAARVLTGSTLRVITSAIEVDGHRATVTTRVLDDRNGTRQLAFSLTKRGDDWLLDRLAIRR